MIVEVDNIELNFGGTQILYGVYVRTEKGKVTGILGRNGSGKTCLLRIIFGSLRPTHKNIRINGAYQKKNLFQTNRVAYLPQHPLLPKTIKLLTAFDLFNANWKEFVSIFNSFQIYGNKRANQLSTGELRVVETYLTLFSEKEIILLDEPFSFIAPVYVEKFKKLIQKRKEHAAIIVTDHFYRDIMEISGSIFLLKNGYSKMIKTKEDLEDEGYVNLK